MFLLVDVDVAVVEFRWIRFRESGDYRIVRSCFSVFLLVTQNSAYTESLVISHNSLCVPFVLLPNMGEEEEKSSPFFYPIMLEKQPAGCQATSLGGIRSRAVGILGKRIFNEWPPATNEGFTASGEHTGRSPTFSHSSGVPGGAPATKKRKRKQLTSEVFFGGF